MAPTTGTGTIVIRWIFVATAIMLAVGVVWVSTGAVTQLPTSAAEAQTGSGRVVTKWANVGSYTCDTVGCTGNVAVDSINLPPSLRSGKLLITVTFRYWTTPGDGGQVILRSAGNTRKTLLGASAEGATGIAQVILPAESSSPASYRLSIQVAPRHPLNPLRSFRIETGNALVTIDAAMLR